MISFPSGKRYIGSATHLQKRRNNHISALRRGSHHNLPMQRAYSKYRESGFQFQILIYCSRANLLLYEQICIQGLNPEYNVAKEAGSPMAGRQHTVAARLKMSAKRHSVETRKEMSLKRAKPVICVETGEIFGSSVVAGQWCRDQLLTQNKYAHTRISANIISGDPAYGFHWKRV